MFFHFKSRVFEVRPPLLLYLALQHQASVLTSQSPVSIYAGCLLGWNETIVNIFQGFIIHHGPHTASVQSRDPFTPTVANYSVSPHFSNVHVSNGHRLPEALCAKRPAKMLWAHRLTQLLSMVGTCHWLPLLMTKEQMWYPWSLGDAARSSEAPAPGELTPVVWEWAQHIVSNGCERSSLRLISVLQSLFT